MNKEYTIREMSKKIVMVLLGIIVLSIVTLPNNSPVQVVEEKVQVVSVPNGSVVEVIYENEVYEVILPMTHYTTEMSQYAKTLMANGVIELKDFTVIHSENEIYPSGVLVDGEDAVALITNYTN